MKTLNQVHALIEQTKINLYNKLENKGYNMFAPVQTIVDMYAAKTVYGDLYGEAIQNKDEDAHSYSVMHHYNDGQLDGFIEAYETLDPTVAVNIKVLIEILDNEDLDIEEK